MRTETLTQMPPPSNTCRKAFAGTGGNSMADSSGPSNFPLTPHLILQLFGLNMPLFWAFLWPAPPFSALRSWPILAFQTPIQEAEL